MADEEQARLAREIYERLGGANNILRAANCMTRLRVQLAKKDEALIASVKGVKGVLGVMDAGDEFQVVLGPGKAQEIADEVRAMMEADRKAAPAKTDVKAAVGDGKELQAAIRAKNATPVKRTPVNVPAATMAASIIKNALRLLLFLFVWVPLR